MAQDELEKICQDLERRICKLEQRNQNPIQRVKSELSQLQLFTSRLQRVHENYYHLTLLERAQLLNTSSDHLCKSIVLHNTSCRHENCDDITDSKYYCVIIQYSQKLSR
jgi:hypothetical protein